jgi:hypothetical protein
MSMNPHHLPMLGDAARRNNHTATAFAVMSTVLLALMIYREARDVLWEKRTRHDAGYRLLRELDRLEEKRGWNR